MTTIDRHVMGSDVTNEAIEIIRRADQAIIDHGWCQGRYVNDQGRYCTIGALRVARNEYVSAHVPEPRAITYMDAYQVAVDTVQWLVDHEASPMRATTDVITWNDRDERTVEDVHLMFKNAIDVLESPDA